MNLLQLAKKAKGVITGSGTWTQNEREDACGAHCAMGAIEEALGIVVHNEGERPGEGAEGDKQGQALIEATAIELGFSSFKEWKQQRDNDGLDINEYEQYISDAVGCIEAFNDQPDTTQRKVQGLFQRVINKLSRAYQERRAKRTVKALLKNAVETPLVETEVEQEKERV